MRTDQASQPVLTNGNDQTGPKLSFFKRYKGIHCVIATLSADGHVDLNMYATPPQMPPP